MKHYCSLSADLLSMILDSWHSSGNVLCGHVLTLCIVQQQKLKIGIWMYQFHAYEYPSASWMWCDVMKEEDLFFHHIHQCWVCWNIDGKRCKLQGLQSSPVSGAAHQWNKRPPVIRSRSQPNCCSRLKRRVRRCCETGWGADDEGDPSASSPIIFPQKSAASEWFHVWAQTHWQNEHRCCSSVCWC